MSDQRLTRIFLALGVMLACAPWCAAQEPPADCPLHGGAPTAEAPLSSYAGEQTRRIKALSEDQRQQLLDGHGMGLARAAELNHYPGPKHVMELATVLDLTDAQTGRTREIFHEMRERARALGQQIIAAEARLDADFASGTITEAALNDAVHAIGRLQADLRLAHLRAHLQMRAALTPAQIERYDVGRGYTSPTGPAAPHSQPASGASSP